MKRIILFLTSALLFCLSSAQAQKFVGGDLSMLPKYEEQKASYLDKDGKTISDLLAYVKEQGWNTVRVRLFNEPSRTSDKAVCQDQTFVTELGKRIKEAGLYFLLDFHYSDTWADPEHQYIPWYTWNNVDPTTGGAEDNIFLDLSIGVATEGALNAMVKAGATPDFIQIGNEISFGMLWGTYINNVYEEWDRKGGHLEANSDWTDYTDKHWDNFANFLKTASKVCRRVCPDAKIILHTEQCANNPTLDVAFFKRIKQYEIDYDIIGTSYYPYFKGPLSNLDKGLSELEKNFPDKEIQVVETGYPSKWEVPGTSYDYTKTYPYSHEGQRQYTADLITMLKKHKQVNGLSWWYAEANAKDCTGDLKEGWYNASLFDNETGRALPALYELKNFNDESTGIKDNNREPITNNHETITNNHWFTLDGRKFNSAPHQKGLYISNRQKVLIK